MLRRLVLLIALFPAIALAAAPANQLTIPTASPSPSDQSAPAQQQAQSPTLPPSQSSIAAQSTPAPWAAPTDASSCRIACANSAYVCRAGDQPDSCNGAWSQCVATCNSPNLDPGVSTAP